MIQKKKERTISITLVQGGLNERSSTVILIDETARSLSRRGMEYHIVDVRLQTIDFWDGRPFEKYSDDTQTIVEAMARTNGYIFSVPVYASAVSGAVKNIITLASHVMKKKAAGIMACSSVGVPSYPAVHDLIGVLSKNAQVATVQPVVYASSEEFRDGKVFDEQIIFLIEEMIDALLKRCLIDRRSG